jgi:hypothetical protein
MDNLETQTTLGTQDTGRRLEKTKGQSREDNLETQTTLCTQDTVRHKQNKQGNT